MDDIEHLPDELGLRALAGRLFLLRPVLFVVLVVELLPVLRGRATDVPEEKLREVVGVLVAYLPGDLIQAFRGRRERELRF